MSNSDNALNDFVEKLLIDQPQLKFTSDEFNNIMEEFEHIKSGLDLIFENMEALCREIIILLMTKPSLKYEINYLFKKKAFVNMGNDFSSPDCKIAYLYKSLGLMLSDRMEYAQAIEMFLSEYNIRRKIANENPGKFNDKITDRLSYAKCCYKLGDAYEHIGDISNAFSYIKEGLEQFENSFTSFDMKDDSNRIVLIRLTTVLYKAKFANRIAEIFKRQEPYNYGAQIHYREIALSADQKFLLMESVSLQDNVQDEGNDAFKLRVNQIRLCVEMAKAFYHLGLLNNNYDYLMRAVLQVKMNIQLVENLMNDYKNSGISNDDDYICARKRKCLLCLAQSFQMLGCIYHKLRNSDPIAQEYYQKAIATIKEIERPHGNTILLLAELYFEFEKKFITDRYHYEMEAILKRYPHIYDFQRIAVELNNI